MGYFIGVVIGRIGPQIFRFVTRKGKEQIQEKDTIAFTIFFNFIMY